MRFRINLLNGIIVGLSLTCAIPLATRGQNVAELRKPIEAQIIARGKPYVRHDPDNEWWNKLISPVTVDAGRARGLKPKLVLHILDGPGAEEKGELVLITKVNLRTARGVIERSVRKQPCVKFSKTDDCTNPEYAQVNVGSRLTTDPFSAELLTNRF